MKKFTSLFIVLSLLAINNSAFAFEYQGLNFSVISEDDRTVSVSKSGNGLEGEIVIPEIAIDGENEYTVTEIENYGFASCFNITSVIMPNTVTKVGMDGFFNCSALETVVLSEALVTIDKFAFNSCIKLKTIDLPATLETIGNQAFANCQALESICVDEANVSFSTDSGVLFSKDKTKLLVYPNKKGTEYEVPSFVTVIGENAFYGCKDVKSITVGSNVKSVLEGAFYMCSSLESMTLPNSVTTLEDWTFAYCSSLKSVVLPEDINTVGNDLFAGCGKLEEIIIPDAVESIGRQAFHSCSSLNNVVWGKGIASVGSEAFSGCKSLVLVEMSSPVTEVGQEAFYGCSEMKKLVLPAELESISDAIILDCAKLDTVVSHAVNPPVCSTFAFEGLPSECKLYVPFGCSADYQNASGWNKFSQIFEMEGSGIDLQYSGEPEIYSSGNMLVVDNISVAEHVSVYGMDGLMVAEFVVQSGNNTIRLEEGIYVVKCGDNTVKVVLR